MTTTRPSRRADSLARFADLRVDVGPPQVLGSGPRGLRRLVPIIGGEAQGEGWRARVLPGAPTSS